MTEFTEEELEHLESIARDSFWQVYYHEHELPKAARKLAVIKSLIARANLPLDINKEEYEEFDDEDFDGGEDDYTDSVQNYAKYLLYNATSSIDYHERNISRYEQEKVVMKVLLRRIGVDDDFFREIEKSIRDRYEKRKR